MVQRELLEISLREMREMAGETQADVAEKLDKTQSELSRIEHREGIGCSRR